MMAIVSPPPVDVLPPAPNPNVRSTFNLLAYPWAESLTVFRTQLNALGANVYGNALHAQSFAQAAVDFAAAAEQSAFTAATVVAEAADQAAQQATLLSQEWAEAAENFAQSAQVAKNTALALANFKGLYSSLTGNLNQPASVELESAIWMLLVDLPDVTLSVPGPSNSDWLDITPVTPGSTQTLTNKTISGADNTLTVDGTHGVGFRNIPQNSQSANYTAVLADSGKHIHHPSADTTARTFTIPANSSVAFPIGTAITFINQNGAGVITIAITTDTMRLAGAGTTGSRTLAANGVATAVKIAATQWIISGTGLT